MLRSRSLIPIALTALVVSVSLSAQTTRVDLSKEAVGRRPVTFEPMVGTWVVAEVGGEKVIKLDGVAYKSAQDNAGRLLIENARKFYGTTNEDLMDNAKQFAFYPIAVLNGVNNFSNGTISMKFKSVAGDTDRASGILFNVKDNGDWLAVRYNDPEHNIALWEFHNGVRRAVSRPATGRNQLTDPADLAKWHELKLVIDGANLKTYLNDALVLEYVLGSDPAPGRGGAAPHPDLVPANNAVLRPPVTGKVGLWSKGDSTSYFKDFVVTPK